MPSATPQRPRRAARIVATAVVMALAAACGEPSRAADSTTAGAAPAASAATSTAPEPAPGGAPAAASRAASSVATPTATPAAPTAARFVYDTAPGAAYVAEIWVTDSASQVVALARAREALPSGARSGAPAGAAAAATPRGVLVARAYNGERVVRITRWDGPDGASAYAQAARAPTPRAGLPTPRTVEVLRVRSVARKPGQPLAVDSTTPLQFSQFLMRRRAPVDTLQAMAAGMSGGMVQAEPTLKLISTLTAPDSSVVAFLGAWDSPKGFDVFAERKTFSAKPYWDPYARNEHHMMHVVAASTRP